ncbi:hypothetical protein LguiA_033453 [Lonicera macranthoides]
MRGTALVVWRTTVLRSFIETSMPAMNLLNTKIVEGKEMKRQLHNLEMYVNDMNSNISNELSAIKKLLCSIMGKQSQFMIVRSTFHHIRNSPVHDPLLDQMPRDGSSATLGTSSSSNMNHSLLDGVSHEINGFTGKVIGKGMIDATPEKRFIFKRRCISKIQLKAFQILVITTNGWSPHGNLCPCTSRYLE